MSSNWTAIQILTQAASELGLGAPASLEGDPSVQVAQLKALLNSAGADLVLLYPWQQLATKQTLVTVENVDAYDVPTDLAYYRDQTQWDVDNRWPMLGPKSAQEWAWIKNASVAGLPRMRFRIQGGQIKLHPVPTSVRNLYMEYISRNWLINHGTNGDVPTDMVTKDVDTVLFDPWLVIKFVKLKFFSLKGFDTKVIGAEFKTIFDALTGKDTGAEKLSLAPVAQTPLIGPWSIPDGSWQT